MREAKLSFDSYESFVFDPDLPRMLSSLLLANCLEDVSL